MGTYEHGMDAKGRVIIPAKYRDGLGESFVLTVGLDGCLYAYPQEEWDDFISKLEELPGNQKGRKLVRYFASKAMTCEVDKQGRVLVPANLREEAGLLKDIVFVGVLSKIEIWSKERWEDNDDYDDVDDIVEQMSEFGLNF